MTTASAKRRHQPRPRATRKVWKCRGCGSFTGQRRLSGKLFLALTCLGCEKYCYVCVQAGRHDQGKCLEEWSEQHWRACGIPAFRRAAAK